MRLECQSSGGKPAPRIEWLNVSSAPDGSARPEQLQWMRSTWPIKRLHLAPASPDQAPLTSSSVTITLSRADQRSRFVCLVLPSTGSGGAAAQSQAAAAAADQLAPEWRRPEQWARLLDQLPMLASARAAGAQTGHAQPMFKWIKLNVFG